MSTVGREPLARVGDTLVLRGVIRKVYGPGGRVAMVDTIGGSVMVPLSVDGQMPDPAVTIERAPVTPAPAEDLRPSLGSQMHEALRNQFARVAAAQAVDRRGWTRDQWVADARDLMGHIDGSVRDLVNGHAMMLLEEIDDLEVVRTSSVGAHALLQDAEEALGRVRALCATFDPTSGAGRARAFVADLLASLPPHSPRPPLTARVAPFALDEQPRDPAPFKSYAERVTCSRFAGHPDALEET